MATTAPPPEEVITPLSHGNTGATIQTNNIQDRLDSFEKRLAETTTGLAETRTELAKTNKELAETKTKLHHVETRVALLEGQIIALYGDRAFLAIRSIFDVAEIALEAWARTLGNIQAHQCSVSEYMAVLTNGTWKEALDVALLLSATAEDVERLEEQCQGTITSGFRVEWPHLVRWTEGGQLILRGHLKWLLDASFKLFYWAKVQTRNINKLPVNQLPDARKPWWRAQFNFNQPPRGTPSLFRNFQADYDLIIRYLVTQREGRYLTVAEFETLLTTLDPTDQIRGLQMAWRSCCDQLWEIQHKYDVEYGSNRPPFILNTAEHISNLPIDIALAVTAEQPWMPRNRVSKAEWMRRVGLPLSSDPRFD